MKMPEEVAIHFKKSWLNLIRKEHFERVFEEDYLKDHDVERFENHAKNQQSGYLEVLQKISEEEKLVPDFWQKVVLGNYSLYFDTFPTHQVINQDGQIFML